MNMRILKTIVTALLLTFSIQSWAGNPPGPPSNHGSSNDESPSGGGAPIGEGLGILLLLAGAYGSNKWFLQKSSEEKQQK